MKNTFSAAFKIVLFLLLGGGLLPGCQSGEDGPPGPQGADGTKGATGIKGLDGEALVKTGNITGNVTGQRGDGSALNETYRLDFMYNSNPTTINKTSTGYAISFTRLDSLLNTSASLSFQTDLNFKNPKLMNGNFSLRKRLENNDYALNSAYLSYYNDKSTFEPATVTGAISNVVYNPVTGLLTGNYAWQVDNTEFNDSGYINGNYYYVYYVNRSNSGKSLQVSGTFSIPMKVRSYRVRAGQ
jgi:hypothetical protein